MKYEVILCLIYISVHEYGRGYYVYDLSCTYQTLVVTQNQVSCRSDEYFRRPDEFVPERWLKDSAEYEPVSPYLVLPFGHGPRTCIARRLAEQFLQVVLIKVSEEKFAKTATRYPGCRCVRAHYSRLFAFIVFRLSETLK